MLFYASNIVYQGSYQWLDLSDLQSGQDVFHWLWMFGFLPVVRIVLFAVPLSLILLILLILLLILLILRLSRPVSFGCALAEFVVVDYAFYVFFNSQKPVGAHGLWHEIIGLAVLGLLFHGRIRPIFTRKVSSGQ